ncbi:alpha/beta fold hydrolase [Amycolatopsis sp. FDAARGOS 1241]|uniref:alpha/beta fold hydrolase n=1 Tax=Amycolatopsis sp. FDAARGOS 1241 TaxID=2778070 RepID=UPI0019519120|nr:alpha/beta hydrolase [Amycolatopsis sp. FDAARGOS 1241]QRP43700.1 alpha/beta hydrolase [Amycolatopsis sp. FDAARGOS 1241]
MVTDPEQLTLTVGTHRHSALAAGPESGELVLLLHGWAEFADSWTAELGALGAAGYRAVAVDQRGYAAGARPLDVDQYSVRHLITDVIAFAAALGHDRFHLVAHDWGGMVGWAFASAHPDQLRSLTVLTTPHPAALHRAATDDQRQFRDLGYVRFFRNPDGRAEASLLADDAAGLRATYGDRVPAELVERNISRLTEPGALTAALNWYRGGPATDEFDIPAGRISVPTLYLWGSEDPYLGRTAAELTRSYVDGSYEFEVVEGASHWLPEEAADFIVPRILDHLRRH